MANINSILRVIILFWVTSSLFSCVSVDLTTLPVIPQKSTMTAKTNLALYVDSFDFRGMASRGATFRAEPIMIRYIYNKNFFNSVMGHDEKMGEGDAQALRLKIVVTPKESHKFNWLVTWPAIYPMPFYWPIQYKKGEVSVHIKCEVYTNTGELITSIETEQQKEYIVQIYGFFSSGDAKAKLRMCYESVFASLADKIVSDEKLLALGRSSGKTNLAAVYTNKPPAKKIKQSFSKPVKPLEDIAINTNIDFGNYHALVIGIDNYKYLPMLKTAVNDARGMASLLENQYGFKVTLLVNPSRDEIISCFSQLRRTMTFNDNLLIYYAGHGWLDEQAQEGYWLPVNASHDNEANWVSNSTITSNIRALSAKHIMVIADSCYSGKLTRGLHIRRKTTDYLSRISRKKTRVVLASGGLEPVEDSGGDGNHSVFAAALISTLTDNKSVIDGTDLFSKIKRQVMVNTDQTPEYGDIRKTGHDGGDFLFVSSPR